MTDNLHGAQPFESDDTIEILKELKSKADCVVQRVETIYQLISASQFKHVSKKTRNALVYGLLDESRDVEELSKIAIRSLKKIKRERLQEDDVDALLGVPHRFRTRREDGHDGGQEEDSHSSTDGI